MTSIDHVTLDVPDPTVADAFYSTAFDLGARVRARLSDAETTGFRGFTLSLVVSQPATVDLLINSALDAGATTLKPVKRSLWGYGGVVRAPDGAIWKVATSSKKNTEPASRHIEDIVVLVGASDVLASKRFYVEHGFVVNKSFGRKYVQFTGPPTGIKLALYARRALAKDAGVDPEGSGAHRIVIGAITGNFTDPDGFVWETASSGSADGTNLTQHTSG